ncbi:MAG: efflux RND transporter periplasmic adaptor subunit [Gemmatimonadaceae bacterium]|nr:efflux RND transporter periplasmic adaptor subunit [Gemmatimonadaceae bacterium]
MRRLILLVATGMAAACGKAPPDAAPPNGAPAADTVVLSAESVRIAGFTFDTARQERWTNVVTAPGRVALDPTNTEPIGSIVEGRVAKVYVMPGDRVRRGQVLLAIHSHELMDARATLAKARAATASAGSLQRVATSAADRAERLHGIKALSLAELERARGAKEEADASVATAEAELHRAEALIEHLVGHDALPTDYDEHWVLIRSPIDGQVVARHVDPGNVVLIGAPLVTVSRTSTLVLVVHLPDASASDVRPGSLVRFTTGATGAIVHSARVSRIFPGIDTLTRTVEVHAAIAAAGALRPELFATAEVETGAATSGLVVPAAAVQSFDGDTAVITAEPRDDGLRLTVRRVRVGRRSRDRVEILAGLDANSLVVSGGAAVARAEIIKRRNGGNG